MAQPARPCPHCGAPVARGAVVCRECGSDAETGWSDEGETGGLDRPTGYGSEEEFDYDEWLRSEVESITGRPRWRAARTWKAVGIAVLVVVLALLLAFS